MLKIGLVGLPNVGKSTVFNALSKVGAKVSNYPFCTVECNLGMVTVPDERLCRLGEIFRQQKIVPACIEFVDIAGLVRGASRGEGLGNQFLHHIREVDAILHIVRCFPDEDISHVEGKVDPVRDIEVVNLELGLADLARVDKWLDEARPKTRSGDKHALSVVEALEKLHTALDTGQSVRKVHLSEDVADDLRDLNLLTGKPTLYLANISENESGRADPESPLDKMEKFAARADAGLVVMAAKLESELAELEEAEREEFLTDLDYKPAAGEVIQECYRLLNLITFFTGVGAEVHAWAIPAGTRAQDAAGKIHSDMARGFIRAEVISFDDLNEYGSWEKAREAGHIRLEGKDHTINEGDVCHFRFSV